MNWGMNPVNESRVNERREGTARLECGRLECGRESGGDETHTELERRRESGANVPQKSDYRLFYSTACRVHMI